jgi:hypothetical protein
MTAIKPRFLLLPLGAVLLAAALAACTPKDDRPAPPQTGEPAPPATVSPAEDRGHPQPGQPAATTDPTAPDHAFTGVEAGEVERAASKRGHDSAGETPASGGGQ